MRALATIWTFLICATAVPGLLWGQGVAINTTGAAPNGAAVLDVASTSQGMLTPRMTQAERDAIAAPATGLLIYQTDNRPGFRFYDGTDWVYLRGMTSVPGRMDIDAGCIVTTFAPSAYPGFASTFDCVNGTGQVTWPAGIFQNPPVVNLSSAVVPVPPPAPDIYCIPQYSASCNVAFNADQITGVRVYESTTGIGGPYNIIMDRSTSGAAGTGCDDPGNGNYYAVPIAEATCTMNGNVGGACSNNFYNMEIRSSVEWFDDVQAWIDWNADGDFLDPQEHIPPTPIWGGSNGAWVPSDNFSVPNFALNGNTVMRCRSIWIQSGNPCQGATFGETEDYTITIACATSGPAPEISSVCTVVDVTTTSFDFKCTLLSGFPADPPEVNFDLVPAE